MNYQRKVNELLKEDHAMITKLYLLYEINCKFGKECDDEIVNKIYQAYLDDDYENVNDFVDAMYDRYIADETDFDLIDLKILSDI